MSTLTIQIKGNMHTGSELHTIDGVKNEKLGIPPFWLPAGKIEKSVLIWGTFTCKVLVMHKLCNYVQLIMHN